MSGRHDREVEANRAAIIASGHVPIEEPMSATCGHWWRRRHDIDEFGQCRRCGDWMAP